MLLAIDASLNESGICIFDDTEDLIYRGVIKNKDKLEGMARLSYIKTEIINLINNYRIDEVGIEDYSYGSKGQSILNLAELGGVIRLHLYENNIKYTVVPPTTLKKFITGKGNVKKELMLLKVFKKYGVEFDNNNICDAFCVGRYIMSL